MKRTFFETLFGSPFADAHEKLNKLSTQPFKPYKASDEMKAYVKDAAENSDEKEYAKIGKSIVKEEMVSKYGEYFTSASPEKQDIVLNWYKHAVVLRIVVNGWLNNKTQEDSAIPENILACINGIAENNRTVASLLNVPDYVKGKETL